jgi:hypothetical protein
MTLFKLATEMTRPVFDVIVRTQAANEKGMIEGEANEHRRPSQRCGSR